MRPPYWPMLLYAVLSLAALAAIPLSAAGVIARDPLSAIPAVLLALPWSLAIIAIESFDSPLLNSALILGGIALNVWLLWRLGRHFSRRAS